MKLDIYNKVEHMLRGAAKHLGCNSATLLLVDEERSQLVVRIGAYQTSIALVSKIESFLGAKSREITIPISAVYDSMLIRCWRQKEALETDSIYELLGKDIPGEITNTIAELVGKHRFLCVPALGTREAAAVILFEKEDLHPYSIQQRELMLKYASYIGLIFDMQKVESEKNAAGLSFAFNGGQLGLILADTVPLIFLTPDLKIAFAGNLTEPLLGYDTALLSGMPITKIIADDSFLRDMAINIRSPNEFIFNDTIEMIHKEGHKVTLLVQTFCMVDEFEKITGIALVLRNPDQFTPREKEFAKLLRRERLAAMGEIAAQLAHEIRNPLISIGATIEMLALVRSEDDDLISYLETASRELARVDAILTDYLSLAARYQIVVSDVNVADLVAEAVKVAKWHHFAVGKKIETNIPPEALCKMDYNGMKQVLLNLLYNALEASPEGASVICDGRIENELLIITITDNGYGLPKDIDPFEPFFSTKEKGSGLGLTVCKRIVEAHGGSIELKNASESGGCVARIRVPTTPSVRLKDEQGKR